MEELIQKPNRIMKEIQKFIGLDIRSYNKLPHSNTGNRVSRNYLSARINGKSLVLILEFLSYCFVISYMAILAAIGRFRLSIRSE